MRYLTRCMVSYCENALHNWHNWHIVCLIDVWSQTITLLSNSCILLTLNVRGPSYLGITRSISWLLMPWLLTSPGHQQPWYWLCRIGMSWLIWGRISNNCVVSIWRNDTKWKYMFMFPLKKLARKGLIHHWLTLASEMKPLSNVWVISPYSLLFVYGISVTVNDMSN